MGRGGDDLLDAFAVEQLDVAFGKGSEELLLADLADRLGADLVADDFPEDGRLRLVRAAYIGAEIHSAISKDGTRYFRT